MQHVISVLLLVVAWCVYSLGYGPLFFGAPFVGIALVAVGVALEVWVWFRLRREGQRPFLAGLMRRPNPSLQRTGSPSAHCASAHLPSQRCAQLGAAELQRWAVQ